MSIFAANNTALITGGASGIGLAVAHLCHSHNMRILLADRSGPALAAAHASLSHAPTVSTHEIDVSQPTAWDTLAAAAQFHLKTPRPSLLMLNAGIGVPPGDDAWANRAYFDTTLQTNLFGVIYGLNAFVPAMRQPGAKAAIVITGSKQGITNPPGNPAYNASKAAVRSLAEHLSFDLRETDTAVHLLVPGWTHTGMTGGGKVKEKPAGAWAPEQVAGELERAVGEGRFYVICPDNEVSVETDRRRVLWTAGDLVEGRAPLSRWRGEWKGEAERFMKGE